MHADDRAVARLTWARLATEAPDLSLRPASSDASFRSYWRASLGARSLIVMDSPPALEDPRPWLDIGARLAAAGLHVPAVYAHDVERGFLLIEDLGDQLYLPALDERRADALYADALDALLQMQSKVDVGGLPAYDAAFLHREMSLLSEWFIQRHLGYTPTPEESARLERIFDGLLDNAAEQPSGFVHRDFHSRNLLVLPAGANPGIIDFQGALVGPVTYDLASLLRDCYITWDEARVRTWAEAYRQRLRSRQLIDTTVTYERFQRWFDLTGLQRHIKVLGLFCRLFYRDGKAGYLADLPRVLRYAIGIAAQYPELHYLAELLQRISSGRTLTTPRELAA